MCHFKDIFLSQKCQIYIPPQVWSFVHTHLMKHYCFQEVYDGGFMMDLKR